MQQEKNVFRVMAQTELRKAHNPHSKPHYSHYYFRKQSQFKQQLHEQ